MQEQTVVAMTVTTVFFASSRGRLHGAKRVVGEKNLLHCRKSLFRSLIAFRIVKYSI